MAKRSENDGFAERNQDLVHGRGVMSRNAKANPRDATETVNYHQGANMRGRKTAVLLCVLCILIPVALALQMTGNGIFTKHKTTVPVDLSELPAFSGSPAAEVHGNVPYFEDSELTTVAAIHLSELDALGRCRSAFACLGPETVALGERGSIGGIQPTGWRTIRYDFIDNGYLYNRCHLLMWKASSILDDPRNLITGTRYMNTEGMLPYEEKLLELVESTGFHVLYRVTPIFEGKNLLASGVLMEAKSVEDSGKSLQFCVYAYNVQPGIGIDYATGENWPVDGETEETTDETSVNANKQEYVLNLHTKKFHYPNCPSVSQMKQENRKNVTISREKLLAQGYVPCGSCHP